MIIGGQLDIYGTWNNVLCAIDNTTNDRQLELDQKFIIHITEHNHNST